MVIFFSKKDTLKYVSRICKEENKEQTEVVPIDVGFIEGQVSYFLGFSVDWLQSYNF